MVQNWLANDDGESVELWRQTRPLAAILNLLPQLHSALAPVVFRHIALDAVTHAMQALAKLGVRVEATLLGAHGSRCLQLHQLSVLQAQLLPFALDAGSDTESASETPTVHWNLIVDGVRELLLSRRPELRRIEHVLHSAIEQGSLRDLTALSNEIARLSKDIVAQQVTTVIAPMLNWMAQHDSSEVTESEANEAIDVMCECLRVTQDDWHANQRVLSRVFDECHSDLLRSTGLKLRRAVAAEIDAACRRFRLATAAASSERRDLFDRTVRPFASR
ncbi:MAG: hypothetical protein MHM6MM_006801 [Cercozoa sp. M6MM]